MHTEKTIFGFWIYLMTDLIMFATLFATYAVLRNNIAGGPSGEELFSLPFVLVETLILLVSSFTAGLATIALYNKNKNLVIGLFGITFLLGVSFVMMELKEFSHLIQEGFGPSKSAFLSSFFTLVGTHGLHIVIGLLWMAIGIAKVWYRGLTPLATSQLIRLSLFWHFLDVVWIFIFTIVYLFGII